MKDDFDSSVQQAIQPYILSKSEMGESRKYAKYQYMAMRVCFATKKLKESYDPLNSSDLKLSPDSIGLKGDERIAFYSGHPPQENEKRLLNRIKFSVESTPEHIVSTVFMIAATVCIIWMLVDFTYSTAKFTYRTVHFTADILRTDFRQGC